MKKLFAMLLAVVMMMSLATVAFADPVNATVDTSRWTAEARNEAIKLHKVYTVTGSDNGALYPTEILKFTVTADQSNPDTEKVTVNDLEVSGNSNQDIVINLPVYDTVGVYKYTITEDDGVAQGVDYTDAEIALQVLVAYDYEHECLTSEIVLATVKADEWDGENKKEGQDGKEDTFTNTYDVGKLTVSKTVSGNLADSNAYFEMLVTFTAETGKVVESDIPVTGGSLTAESDVYEDVEGQQTNPTVIAEGDWVDGVATKTIYLKAGDTLTFADIPAGVSYTVVENAKHILQANEIFDPNSEHDKQYNATYTNENGKIASGTTSAAAVNNDKGTAVNTGILMDSAPYVVMLLVAAAGLVLFTNKRRVQD